MASAAPPPAAATIVPFSPPCVLVPCGCLAEFIQPTAVGRSSRLCSVGREDQCHQFHVLITKWMPHCFGLCYAQHYCRERERPSRYIWDSLSLYFVSWRNKCTETDINLLRYGITRPAFSTTPLVWTKFTNDTMQGWVLFILWKWMTCLYISLLETISDLPLPLKKEVMIKYRR